MNTALSNQTDFIKEESIEYFLPFPTACGCCYFCYNDLSEQCEDQNPNYYLKSSVSTPQLNSSIYNLMTAS